MTTILVVVVAILAIINAALYALYMRADRLHKKLTKAQQGPVSETLTSLLAAGKYHSVPGVLKDPKAKK